MQITYPTILIAIGGALLVTQRHRWLVVGALALQWLGLAWAMFDMPAGRLGGLTELITLVVCLAVMAITLTGLDGRAGRRRRFRLSALLGGQSALDAAWLWGITLVAGVAGYGLAGIYAFPGAESRMLDFYWIALPALLALLIDSPRDPVKLAAGLLSLANAAVLLLYVLSPDAPSTASLGLAALGRIALASVVAYTWTLLATYFGGLNLTTLYDARSGRVTTETALVVVEQPEPEPAPAEEGEPQLAKVAGDE
ncbi:MAG TPA: hypothetical protein VFR15_09065 [Chloroflexia bacterium]|nr:hypothetical protein [Chloroflexia bacterium]